MNALAQIIPADVRPDEVLQRIGDERRIYLEWQRRWSDTARPKQIVPGGDWTEYGFLAGRGYGKTRIGAEWITRAAYEDPNGFDSAVIAPTYSDTKFTCYEGESGILSVLPPEGSCQDAGPSWPCPMSHRTAKRPTHRTRCVCAAGRADVQAFPP